MTSRWRVLVALLGVIATLLPVSLDAQGSWKSLFDGRTLTGWNQVGDANWHVKEGAIWGSRGVGFLVSPTPYTDFQIRLEFWVTPDANSGVFIRGTDPKSISTMTAFEVNIFDRRPDQTYRTGAIVDVARPATLIDTGNKWNTFDITAKGSRFTVILNGTKVVDNAENATRPRGHIALQCSAGIVRFRNIRIRTL